MENKIEQLRNIIKHYIDDDKDLDNVMSHIKKIKFPSSGLVPLNRKEIHDILCSESIDNGNNCCEKADIICSKFGTKEPLGVENIKKVLDDEHYHIINLKLAQAIHKAMMGEK